MRGLIAITVVRLLILVVLAQGVMALASTYYQHHRPHRSDLSDASASLAAGACKQCDARYASADQQGADMRHAHPCKTQMHSCICAAIHASPSLAVVASIAPELELNFGHPALQISSHFPSVPRHPPMTLL